MQVLDAHDPITLDNALAIQVWNALANGMGGIDWSGLELQCALLGVQDIEALCHALLAIKTHASRPRDEEDRPAPPEAPPETL